MEPAMSDAVSAGLDVAHDSSGNGEKAEDDEVDFGRSKHVKKYFGSLSQNPDGVQFALTR